MNLNIVIAVVLIFIAVADSVVARFVLPKAFKAKTGELTSQQKMLLRIIDSGTYVFLAGGLAVYFLKPLGDTAL